MSIGFQDKLYWRPVRSEWHCFKKTLFADGVTEFLSLCEQFTRKRSNGQSCSRPPALLRCPRCDIGEMKRRNKEESLPELENWRRFSL